MVTHLARQCQDDAHSGLPIPIILLFRLSNYQLSAAGLFHLLPVECTARTVISTLSIDSFRQQLKIFPFPQSFRCQHFSGPGNSCEFRCSGHYKNYQRIDWFLKCSRESSVDIAGTWRRTSLIWDSEAVGWSVCSSVRREWKSRATWCNVEIVS